MLEDPKTAKLLADALADIIHKDGIAIDTVCAPALGGLIAGFALATALDKRSIFAERVNGEMQIRRGFEIKPGEKVLICEDIITTGETVKQLIKLVESMGGQVVGVGAIWQRSTGTKFKYPCFTIVTRDVPTFAPAECPMCRQGIPIDREPESGGGEDEAEA